MKNRQWYFIGLICVGLVLNAAAFLAGDLPDYNSGLLCGMGSGLLAVGVIMLVKLRRLAKDPEKAAEYEASMKDERMIYISNKAKAWTFVLTVIAELAGGLVATFAFNQRVLGQALCYLVCFQCFLYVVIFRILNRKY